MLREFISTNPSSFVDFFYIKITLCHYSKLEGFILARLSREGHYYYHEMSWFHCKGKSYWQPFQSRGPGLHYDRHIPWAEQILLHSRWFVGTLRILFFKKRMGHIHSRQDMKWFKMEALFMVSVAHHPFDFNWRDWCIVLTNWLVIFLRINVPPSYNCTRKCFCFFLPLANVGEVGLGVKHRSNHISHANTA